MSNKTPKKQPEETASEHKAQPTKNPVKLFIGVLAIIFGAIALYGGISGLLDNTPRLIAPNGTINLEIADTQDSRTKGLSGRTTIDDKYGMLFDFDIAKKNNCLVMRDMVIAIDMIWLNDKKEVITVKENATPESYPEVFCPDEPAKYALEIGSGRSESLGIKPGVQLKF